MIIELKVADIAFREELLLGSFFHSGKRKRDTRDQGEKKTIVTIETL